MIEIRPLIYVPCLALEINFCIIIYTVMIKCNVYKNDNQKKLLLIEINFSSFENGKENVLVVTVSLWIKLRELITITYSLLNLHDTGYL